jgi:regulatory protein
MGVRDRQRRATPLPGLRANDLDRLALAYVGRYSTTARKLSDYLLRKVAQRGWADADPPAVDVVVGRMAELKYIDDEVFAGSRAATLTRRGLGARRVTADLMRAGIDRDTVAAIGGALQDKADAAALAYARRRRLGPFAATLPDPATRTRHLAAMYRAGHDYAIARRVLDLDGDFVQDDLDIFGI